MNLELDLDSGKSKIIKTVDIGKLSHSRFNTRRTRSAASVDKLAERINRLGFEITRAPWVYPVGDRYEVFAGGTRFESAKKAALEELPVVVHEGYTDDEIARLADEDNEADEYHTKVPRPDFWAECYRLRHEEGWSAERIGEAKNVGRQMVYHWLNLHGQKWAEQRCLVTERVETACIEFLAIVQSTGQLDDWLTTDQARTEAADEILPVGKDVPVRKVAKAVVTWVEAMKAAKACYLQAEGAGEKWASLFIKLLVGDQSRTETEVKRILAIVLAEKAEEEAKLARTEQEKADEAKRIADKAKEDAVRAARAAEAFQIVQCDISNLSNYLNAELVDVILTDPPYSKEFLPLYSTLAEQSAKVLKPGGSCFVMIGQSYLPEILDAMCKHLKYHWMLAYLTPGGQSVQLWQREVETFWKPVLWFTKGEYEGDWIGDVAKSAVNDNDKRFHDWGQSESGMLDLVRRCTRPNQLILDPFCGAGTTGVAVLAEKKRKFIGCDIDVECVKKTVMRCREVVDAW